MKIMKHFKQHRKHYLIMELTFFLFMIILEWYRQQEYTLVAWICSVIGILCLLDLALLYWLYPCKENKDN